MEGVGTVTSRDLIGQTSHISADFSIYLHVDDKVEVHMQLPDGIIVFICF